MASRRYEFNSTPSLRAEFSREAGRSIGYSISTERGLREGSAGSKELGTELAGRVDSYSGKIASLSQEAIEKLYRLRGVESVQIVIRTGKGPAS